MKISKKKSSVLKKLKEKEDQIVNILDDIQEAVDSLEDSELSEMGDKFRDSVIDFLEENDLITLNDIREFVESIEES